MRGGSGGGDRNENGDCRRVAASIATIQTAQWSSRRGAPDGGVADPSGGGEGGDDKGDGSGGGGKWMRTVNSGFIEKNLTLTLDSRYHIKIKK